MSAHQALASGQYTALIKQQPSGWWIGWVEEIPGVNAQEASRDELIISLREALRDILELNRQDALRSAGSGYEELALAV